MCLGKDGEWVQIGIMTIGPLCHFGKIIIISAAATHLLMANESLKA